MTSLDTTSLRGSFPPLITPFRNSAVDHECLAALVRHQADAGSQGIVVAGTTGEPSTLTSEERTALVHTAVRAGEGRLTVVAATGSQSHAETVELSMAAVKGGADALLIVTPYYLKPPQRGLVEYFVDLGARVGVPFLIYNIPGRTAVGIEVDSLVQIADRSPNLVGMKHASTDVGFVTEARARLGEKFHIFAGLEELSLPMLALGAAGMMNAVANLVPEDVLGLWNAVSAGTFDEARRYHEKLFELSRALFFETNPIPLKYMMWRIGVLPTAEHRLPMMAAGPALAARLDDVLTRAGLLTPDAVVVTPPEHNRMAESLSSGDRPEPRLREPRR